MSIPPPYFFPVRSKLLETILYIFFSPFSPIYFSTYHKLSSAQTILPKISLTRSSVTILTVNKKFRVFFSYIFFANLMELANFLEPSIPLTSLTSYFPTFTLGNYGKSHLHHSLIRLIPSIFISSKAWHFADFCPPGEMYYGHFLYASILQRHHGGEKLRKMYIYSKGIYNLLGTM